MPMASPLSHQFYHYIALFAFVLLASATLRIALRYIYAVPTDKAPFPRPLSESSSFVKLLVRADVDHCRRRWDGPWLDFTTIQVPLADLDITKYAALSYTWKTPLPIGQQPSFASQGISIDGCLLRVEENLWDFLTSQACAKVWEGSRFLFIDAICIDQSSPSEQKQQLPLLPTIYENAEQTIVWLGREQPLESIRPQPPKLSLSLERRPTGLCGASPQVLHHVACNLYWTRLFVLPEFILAGNILLCVGDNVIEWGDLEDPATLSNLLEHIDSAGLAFQPMLDALRLKRIWDKNRESLDNSVGTQGRGFRLFDALQMASKLDCKHHRDRINAILPLTRNCNICPDYSNARLDFDLCSEVLHFALTELHRDGCPEQEVRDAAEFLLKFCQAMLSGYDQMRTAQLVRELLSSFDSQKERPAKTP